MKVSRRRGVVRLKLEPVESALLVGLLDDLAEALEELSPDDPVRRRLYPDGHRDDATIAGEFRDLTESSLHEERTLRLGQCRAEVELGVAPLELGEDEVRRWLQVTNDLRLAIGTRLGVTEESIVIDPDSPDAQAWAIYHWLSALQDALVDSVMG
ncbi:uncharacterized protein DUF2017 [Jatrophihabitans sp. GAS493]|uniref:DUF2017 family protein n=1 Tax=Jatrophihabitans sp. GAS493 TaxID=1907575 RepID=UPI000BC06045|nr:DUF2017 family protein [Jatrophihabitans sp. GAS493]SOD72638.1 uncharacterized protein DUF2017 [Jatrophihabitans sp. GAS493]